MCCGSSILHELANIVNERDIVSVFGRCFSQLFQFRHNDVEAAWYDGTANGSNESLEIEELAPHDGQGGPVEHGDAGHLQAGESECHRR